MEHTIHGLIKKRSEIAGQHEVAVQAQEAIKVYLDAIDRALVLSRRLFRLKTACGEPQEGNGRGLQNILFNGSLGSRDRW